MRYRVEVPEYARVSLGLLIRKKLAANVRTDEQEVHKRRTYVGDAAKETEARYCAKHRCINEMLT